MSIYDGVAYGQGVGKGFLAGLTTRAPRPKQEALLNHPLEALEPAERATTEMLRPPVTTDADREAVTRAAELRYGFKKLHDAVRTG